MNAHHIDTSDLRADDWRSTIAPAEAATDIGADDYDGAAREGSAIVFLIAVALVIGAALLAHFVASL